MIRALREALGAEPGLGDPMLHGLVQYVVRGVRGGRVHLALKGDGVTWHWDAEDPNTRPLTAGIAAHLRQDNDQAQWRKHVPYHEVVARSGKHWDELREYCRK